MPLTNTQYDSILHSYEEKQNKNRHLLEDRVNEVREKVPGYADICDSIAAVSIAQGEKMLAGDDSALDTLRELLADMRAKRISLLKEAGYPEDYLEPIYDCPDCKDTGYIEREKCHCFKQAMISLLYHQSHIQDMLKTENFSALSYEYYSGDDLVRFRNAVTTATNFVKNFNSDYHNLFFYGTVGTGKSFLSNCVAKELIESGHSVIYFSASTLFDLIAENTFQKQKEAEDQTYRDLYECDLLIIDDLGTELTNQFVASSLFSCLNERHIAKKATVISTNLSLEDLRNRYSDRVFSRITSNFELCKLTGPDVRMCKKRDRK